MPELPEVQTTVNGLNSTVKGRKIVSIWNDYDSPYFRNKDEIKNPKFYAKFKKLVIGQKILKAERRAKNILIHLGNKHTILIHMKMTGHLLYEGYKKDPFNSHIHLYFQFDNGKHLYFSDMRKFAKITLIETGKLKHSIHLSHLGPEPLDKNFQFKIFNFQLHKRPKGKIKQVLMDQTLIAGIGNIYSDEILWRAGVHPTSQVNKIPEKNFKEMFKAMKEVLKKGIDFGGDSMSDYRNIKGEKGRFQEHHRAYQRKGKICDKKGCKGVIQRIIVATRSAHFCPTHQKLFK
ncbi:MAG: DNA-formamidopyrimidine glycosylase [Candidatus Zambryskibacteria bacterium]|nr:DNA-formamidopyrimidine glycosylase [Candidatus Zambryskibacteria bacterium]